MLQKREMSSAESRGGRSVSGVGVQEEGIKERAPPEG